MTARRKHKFTLQRRRAHLFGILAEHYCHWWLRLKGYRIHAGRMRNRGGEIDIIASKRGTLIFAEVKARKRIEDAEHAVTAGKRRRLERAARLYLASHPEYAGHNARFDLILVAPWRLPRHLVDAWRV